MIITGDKKAQMAAAKAAALAAIDSQAEQARAALTTPGVGMAAVYAAKLDQARAFLKESPSPLIGNPNPADYPFLVAEEGITAATLREVAAAIVAKSEQWNVAAAAIERVRLAAKSFIDRATTLEAVSSAQRVEWPQS